jgi:L-ascorbate metabolism protein UlaG (beta-lactamase superfamily)
MIEITWLGHAACQFRLESGEVILVDPWLGNPKAPQGFELSRADVVLITHGHSDHTGEIVSIAQQFSPQIVANYEICLWLNSKGVENTRPMNKGGSQKVGPVTVRMTHALHSSGITDGDQVIYGGEAGGYVIEFPNGRSIYHAGDTSVFSDMALIQQLYKPEVAILPVGDLFTMSPEEAALACSLLKPQRVIPIHFGTFPPLTGTPQKLASLLGAGPQVWELTPGEPVQWN